MLADVRNASIAANESEKLRKVQAPLSLGSSICITFLETRSIRRLPPTAMLREARLFRRAVEQTSQIFQNTQNAPKHKTKIERTQNGKLMEMALQRFATKPWSGGGEGERITL